MKINRRLERLEETSKATHERNMVHYVFRTSADGEKIARYMLPWGDPENYRPRLYRTARNPKAPRWRVHDQDLRRTQVAHCS